MATNAVYTEQDKEDGKTLAMKSFFSSHGYKLFREELDEFVKMNDDEINKITKDRVDEKVLSRLNFELGRKSGLNLVLCLLEGMKEDIAKPA